MAKVQKKSQAVVSETKVSMKTQAANCQSEKAPAQKGKLPLPKIWSDFSADQVKGLWESKLENDFQAFLESEYPNAIQRYGKDLVAQMVLRFLQNGVWSVDDEAGDMLRLKSQMLAIDSKVAKPLQNATPGKPEFLLGIEQGLVRWAVGKEREGKKDSEGKWTLGAVKTVQSKKPFSGKVEYLFGIKNR